MANISLIIDPSPDVTPYDEEYPTRSTELLSAQLHNILVDMNDGGPWSLDDGIPNTSQRAATSDRIILMVGDLFDYAQAGIVNYRDHGSPDLARPASGLISLPRSSIPYKILREMEWGTYRICYEKAFLIYYMWETEEDPLLIKEYLRSLLSSWPLQDTTIELSDQTGQAFRVYPAWNNIEP